MRVYNGSKTMEKNLIVKLKIDPTAKYPPYKNSPKFFDIITFKKEQYHHEHELLTFLQSLIAHKNLNREKIKHLISEANSRKSSLDAKQEIYYLKTLLLADELPILEGSSSTSYNFNIDYSNRNWYNIFSQLEMFVQECCNEYELDLVEKGDPLFMPMNSEGYKPDEICSLSGVNEGRGLEKNHLSDVSHLSITTNQAKNFPDTNFRYSQTSGKTSCLDYKYSPIESINTDVDLPSSDMSTDVAFNSSHHDYQRESSSINMDDSRFPLQGTSLINEQSRITSSIKDDVDFQRGKIQNSSINTQMEKELNNSYANVDKRYQGTPAEFDRGKGVTLLKEFTKSFGTYKSFTSLEMNKQPEKLANTNPRVTNFDEIFKQLTSVENEKSGYTRDHLHIDSSSSYQVTDVRNDSNKKKQEVSMPELNPQNSSPDLVFSDLSSESTRDVKSSNTSIYPAGKNKFLSQPILCNDEINTKTDTTSVITTNPIHDKAVNKVKDSSYGNTIVSFISHATSDDTKQHGKSLPKQDLGSSKDLAQDITNSVTDANYLSENDTGNFIGMSISRSGDQPGLSNISDMGFTGTVISEVKDNPLVFDQSYLDDEIIGNENSDEGKDMMSYTDVGNKVCSKSPAEKKNRCSSQDQKIRYMKKHSPKLSKLLKFWPVIDFTEYVSCKADISEQSIILNASTSKVRCMKSIEVKDFDCATLNADISEKSVLNMSPSKLRCIKSIEVKDFSCPQYKTDIRSIDGNLKSLNALISTSENHLKPTTNAVSNSTFLKSIQVEDFSCTQDETIVKSINDGFKAVNASVSTFENLVSESKHLSNNLGPSIVISNMKNTSFDSRVTQAQVSPSFKRSKALDRVKVSTTEFGAHDQTLSNNEDVDFAYISANSSNSQKNTKPVYSFTKLSDQPTRSNLSAGIESSVVVSSAIPSIREKVRQRIQYTSNEIMRSMHDSKFNDKVVICSKSKTHPLPTVSQLSIIPRYSGTLLKTNNTFTTMPNIIPSTRVPDSKLSFSKPYSIGQPNLGVITEKKFSAHTQKSSLPNQDSANILSNKTDRIVEYATKRKTGDSTTPRKSRLTSSATTHLKILCCQEEEKEFTSPARNIVEVKESIPEFNPSNAVSSQIDTPLIPPEPVAISQNQVSSNTTKVNKDTSNSTANLLVNSNAGTLVSPTSSCLTASPTAKSEGLSVLSSKVYQIISGYRSSLGKSFAGAHITTNEDGTKHFIKIFRHTNKKSKNNAKTQDRHATKQQGKSPSLGSLSFPCSAVPKSSANDGNSACEVKKLEQCKPAFQEKSLIHGKSKRGKKRKLLLKTVDGCSKRLSKVYRLQTSSCEELMDLPMCLDCKDAEKANENYCRFNMFRRLEVSDEKCPLVAGFCSPDEAEKADLVHWTYQGDANLDLAQSLSIIKDIGAQFQQLVLQEDEAQKWVSDGGKIFWKRAVLIVREMCDICRTTIFNTHWTCQECGLGVCLDCFRAALDFDQGKKSESYDWPECEPGFNHYSKNLFLTQIIPKNVLFELLKEMILVANMIGIKFRKLDLLKSSGKWKVNRRLTITHLNELKLISYEDMEDDKDTPLPLAYKKLPGCEWFFNGRMLHIAKPDFDGPIMELFKKEWRNGKPILVSNVHEKMNKDLWSPQSFCRDFGDEKNDVVNCFDGSVIDNLTLKDFWDGFECIAARPKTKTGATLLKLKDWPPKELFRVKMPKRFRDIMQALPATSYTSHEGEMNMASRLPSFFAVPDLGPKMYNAYGSASYPSAGTTNLHLDISDATNVIAYVGVPKDDGIGEKEVADTLLTVKNTCCEKTVERIQRPGVKPGALWHIFPAHSASKIRQFLRRVAQERGLDWSENSDPIHDQSFYLDQVLLEKLRIEEGVVGFPICQCHGDAIFIPAGAPHQVLNLHSCIKVAEDFVAPEHVSHCFQLTQEFRQLSDYHTNHEDKLQIKNTIFHTVKDCLGVIKQRLRDKERYKV